MRRDVPALASEEYDVVVVGGGIYGIAVARDAALRGLDVAILEKRDFAGETSANSFRMVHGGIRYLQHVDLPRLRHSSTERATLLRTAPHLVRPLPIVIPTYGRGLGGRLALRAGFTAYDLLTLDRNRGIRDPERRIPACRMISRAEVLDLFPSVREEGLTGAGVFADGQMHHPARLALAMLASAVAEGARAANYVRVKGFVRARDRVVGVEAVDVLGGDSFQVRGRVVVNAAGSWADRLTRESLGLGDGSPPAFSRDLCFAVSRRPTHPYGLAVLGRTRDPDALLSRSKRHLFMVPWRDRLLVGVWHVVYPGSPDAIVVEEDELREFVEEFNEGYPALELSVDDVRLVNCGLVLFGRNEAGATDLSYGKRSLIEDHARTHGIEGLVTLVGIRWTTARADAERVVDGVMRKLGSKGGRSGTDRKPVRGGAIEDFGAFRAAAVAAHGAALGPQTVEALCHNHGTEYERVVALHREKPEWASRLGDTHVLASEVIHAVREEMAVTLEDVAVRRTDLAILGDPGEEALQRAAALMAGELGWAPGRAAAEVERVRASFPWKRLVEAPVRASPDAGYAGS